MQDSRREENAREQERIVKDYVVRKARAVAAEPMGEKEAGAILGGMREGKAQPQWRWQDSVVADGKEHIELRHGDARKTAYEDWLPVARIGKPKQHLFPVQWLVRPDSPEDQAMLDDARRELNFYLVEKNEPNPWRR